MKSLSTASIFIGVLLLLSLPTILTECDPEFEQRAPELVEAQCHVEAKVQRSRWEYLTVCVSNDVTLYSYSGSVYEQVLLERVRVVADSLAGKIPN